MTPEEQRLLEGVIAGDKLSWDMFITQYSGVIYSAIYKTLAKRGRKDRPQTIRKRRRKFKTPTDVPKLFHTETAKDCFQEVCLLLLENEGKALKSFNDTSKLTTWLFVITKNAVHNFVNRESRKYKGGATSLNMKVGDREESELGDFIEDEKSDIREIIDAEERIDFVVKYIGKLDPEEQLILISFYIDKISLKQIAKILGKSKDAVLMQKTRLLNEINVMYKKKFNEELKDKNGKY